MLAVDRSSKAIEQAKNASQDEIASGQLSVRQVSVENLELTSGEQPYDIAFAVRVGALDGRHPELKQRALRCITKALTRNGRLFIDGGNPLQDISLETYRQE